MYFNNQIAPIPCIPLFYPESFFLFSEVCQFEQFKAKCDPGHVIIMTMARYGRVKLGRCVREDMGLGCTADILMLMDKECSGRQECVIDIPMVIINYPFIGSIINSRILPTFLSCANYKSVYASFVYMFVFVISCIFLCYVVFLECLHLSSIY